MWVNIFVNTKYVVKCELVYLLNINLVVECEWIYSWIIITTLNVNEYKLCEFCTISPTIISVRGQYWHHLFRDRIRGQQFSGDVARGKLFALTNRWRPGTNIRAYFRAKWMLLCLLSFKYFSQHAQFWKFMENWGISLGYSPVLPWIYSVTLCV